MDEHTLAHLGLTFIGAVFGGAFGWYFGRRALIAIIRPQVQHLHAVMTAIKDSYEQREKQRSETGR